MLVHKIPVQRNSSVNMRIGEIAVFCRVQMRPDTDDAHRVSSVHFFPFGLRRRTASNWEETHRIIN